jgi:hypothetical protein
MSRDSRSGDEDDMDTMQNSMWSGKSAMSFIPSGMTLTCYTDMMLEAAEEDKE